MLYISTKEDVYWEHLSSTCTQENNGVSHGRYQHTHRIDDTVVTNNGHYQVNPSSSHRRRKVVSKAGLSKCHPNSFFQICVKVMDLFSITTLLGESHLLLQDNPQQQTEHTKQLPKLVHWNAQGAITETSAIKIAIVQDGLDIMMIQDTRCKRRLDDLPKLRIHGYHTYHRTMDG